MIERPMVVVRRSDSIGYPLLADHSPDTAYPEYPFGDSLGRNRVYGMVRECLRDSGADAEHYATPAWNPLGPWIRTGSRVFVLPNLVVDRRPHETIEKFRSKCTHASVLRPVLDYATIASGSARLVSSGNGSLQSCDYGRVAEETGVSAVANFYREVAGADVGPHDLRAVVTRWTRYGALMERYEQRPEDVVLVDLGSDSLLNEFYRSGNGAELRVSDYDQREMALYHAPGRHVYAVHRRVLEAETIISVPKLKTHEKVGITCALKGTVGAIARKECLAHHRKGGPNQHGDEYPKSTRVRHFASELADRVTTRGSDLASNALRVTSKLLYRSLRLGADGIMSGAWHGNDTAWRMALDIARILRFARVDGTLAATPLRKHLVFIDGIVGGEGEGPVYPTPKPAGVVVFGSDPVWTDHACATLMRFDPRAIPLVAHAGRPMSYAATDASLASVRFVLNGNPVDLSEIGHVLHDGFRPPKGWVDRI